MSEGGNTCIAEPKLEKVFFNVSTSLVFLLKVF